MIAECHIKDKIEELIFCQILFYQNCPWRKPFDITNGIKSSVVDHIKRLMTCDFFVNTNAQLPFCAPNLHVLNLNNGFEKLMFRKIENTHKGEDEELLAV